MCHSWRTQQQWGQLQLTIGGERSSARSYQLHIVGSFLKVHLLYQFWRATWSPKMFEFLDIPYHKKLTGGFYHQDVPPINLLERWLQRKKFTIPLTVNFLRGPNWVSQWKAKMCNSVLLSMFLVLLMVWLVGDFCCPLEKAMTLTGRGCQFFNQ